ncbi:MAG: DNA-processing protein DprA [Rhodocyclaceae bacterium]|nr:DNA-protecting protein DprA [Rhodocyclaceae bacterium]MBX3667831.1 DNA-processing protein DprA [Rhodocyclaceae bacterium]
MADSGLAAWIRLTHTPGIGAASQRALLARFGLPEQIFRARPADLAATIGEQRALALCAGRDAAAESEALAWAEQAGNAIITLADARYPPRLLETPDPPVLLYAKGRSELLAAPALAIVGARNATQQGCQDAAAFARAFAAGGLTVVSGLAQGVDAAAHGGALEAPASTVAVIGTGADRIYPPANAALARRIAEGGCIISELPLGTPARKENFPRRNRIIAGLALGVLVVEAAKTSGALITAKQAGEYGREVFALPGSIHSPLSKGCHALIRQGAKLVESARDVLEELRLPPPATPPADAAPDAPVASADDSLLAALGHGPVGMDELAGRSGLPAAQLLARLTELEMAGLVEQLPGGRLQRVVRAGE